jgi:2,5-diamino-6-(ribosylamino)-4(3H)-pyrimidinone 5'-phosphate reductase
MLPRVIIFNGVSLDGRMDSSEGCGEVDMGLYYDLAGRFGAQAMLSGSETMVSGMANENLSEVETVNQPELYPNHVPYLVVVDSRGQIRNWNAIRSLPYWKEVVVLCAEDSPADYLAYLKRIGVPHIVAGQGHVDLRQALEELNGRFGIQVVRVDSGGILNGILLRAGLVDEVSVLIDATLVGGTSPRSIFVAPDLLAGAKAIPLRLTHMERLKENVVWLRYEVVKS